MCSDRSGTPQRVPGFPIRTSTDRSSVGSSPWLFAATHVLLRLQAPRHPPLALCSLSTKMLVLAMQFSRGAPRVDRNKQVVALRTRGTPSKRNRGFRALPSPAGEAEAYEPALERSAEEPVINWESTSLNGKSVNSLERR